MIGRLKGTLLSKQPPALLVDVNGVGYELEAPMSTFYELGASGSEVTLHIHMVVREDAMLLYAFAKEPERALFRDLIKVSGIGAKTALAVLSGISVDDFRRTEIGKEFGFARPPRRGDDVIAELRQDRDGDRADAAIGAGNDDRPLVRCHVPAFQRHDAEHGGVSRHAN